LRRALDLWPAGTEEPERIAALEQLGDAAQVAGLLPRAMQAWREVAESAADSTRARALRKIANLHELNCEWSRVMDARLDAMAAFAAAGEPAEAALEGITTAIRLRLSARHAAGLEVLASAAAHAEASGREDLKIRLAALKGNLESRLGRYAEGIPTIRAALDAAVKLQNPALAGEIYQRLADAIERSSDFNKGAATNREGIAFCEERDAAGGIVACLTCMSWILVRGGEWEQSAAACRRILESPACNPVTRAVAIGNTGLVHVMRGELRKGEPLLVEADALARRLEHALMEFIARWGLAMCDAANDAHDAAAEKCRAILARWRQTDERHASMPIQRWAASCFARVGDRQGLRACADAFGEAAAAFSHAEPLSGLAHVLGEIALLEGDVTKAVEQFEHAIALLEGMQLPRERVETQLRAAAACAAAGRMEKGGGGARGGARGAPRRGARPPPAASPKQLRARRAPRRGVLGCGGPNLRRGRRGAGGGARRRAPGRTPAARRLSEAVARPRRRGPRRARSARCKARHPGRPDRPAIADPWRDLQRPHGQGDRPRPAAQPAHGRDARRARACRARLPQPGRGGAQSGRAWRSRTASTVVGLGAYRNPPDRSQLKLSLQWAPSGNHLKRRQTMSQNRRIDLNDVSYQMLLEDPTILEQAERQARRERSEAMHELMVAPAVRFFERLPQDVTGTLPRRFAGLCLAATICIAAAAAVV
jgi:tetratricopeptide (TPR) repeat protein